jgi:hypothetical protein
MTRIQQSNSDHLRPSQPYGYRVLVRMEGVSIERQRNICVEILSHPGGTSQSMAVRLKESSVLIGPLHFQLDLLVFRGEMSAA